MTTERSRLANVLKDLALACLNATLLLTLACLLIFYLVATKVDQIATTFAQNLITITPLKDEVAAVNDNLQSLRTDIASLKDLTGEDRDAVSEQLQTRLDTLQGRLDGFNARISALSGTPTQFLDHAVEKAAFEIKSGITEIRTCTAPTQPEPPAEPMSAAQ